MLFHLKSFIINLKVFISHSITYFILEFIFQFLFVRIISLCRKKALLFHLGSFILNLKVFISHLISYFILEFILQFLFVRIIIIIFKKTLFLHSFVVDPFCYKMINRIVKRKYWIQDSSFRRLIRLMIIYVINENFSRLWVV